MFHRKDAGRMSFAVPAQRPKGCAVHRITAAELEDAARAERRRDGEAGCVSDGPTAASENVQKGVLVGMVRGRGWALALRGVLVGNRARGAGVWRSADTAYYVRCFAPACRFALGSGFPRSAVAMVAHGVAPRARGGPTP